jgi:hypothetical protein
MKISDPDAGVQLCAHCSPRAARCPITDYGA